MNYEQKYKDALERAKTLYKSANGMIHKRWVKQVFPELQEIEDERIKYEIKVILTNTDFSQFALDYTFADMIAWLEKQREKIQYWNPSKEQLEALDYAYNSCPDTERGNYYEGVLETLIDDLHKLSEKQGGQKPTNKADSKFHEGEWITDGEHTWFVEGVHNGFYDIISPEGYRTDDTIIHVDEHFHLWNIQDAKKGDVLATSSGSICIFDDTVEDGKYPFAYCGLTKHHGFEVYDRKIPFTHDKDIHPATKEEHDLLFQKMKEAGYAFDFEKKEVKKISWNSLI